MIDRPKLYRDALEKSEWRLTPQQMTAMPVPQQVLVFRDAEPGGGQAGVLKLINARRAKMGLPPIREGKG